MKKVTMIKPMLIALLAAGTSAYAQKNVQEASVRAPNNVKVDGKLSEYNDNFQASNKATLLNYSLTNDDNFLYLALTTTDQRNGSKITAGGITLTINTAGKKNVKDGFSLLYPLINLESIRGQGGGGPGGQGGPPGGGFAGGGGRPPVMDSATIAAQHKRTLDAAKEIKIFGFKDITDSVISVYNEYNIKAAMGYDAKNNLTYELAIPLKALGLSTDSPKEFAYNIKVNGISFPRRDDDRGGQQGDRGGQGGGGFGGNGGGFGGGNGGGGLGGPPGGFGGNGGPPGGMQSMLTPTDFWGKYTVAKK